MKRYQLMKAGVDTNEALNRLDNNLELYENLIKAFLNDNNYADMIKSIENKDPKSTFSYGHALKGVSGNLSFTRLYQAIFPVVELSRKGSLEDVEKYLPEIKSAYDDLIAAIKA